jgi:hypothetical protein
MNTLVHLLVVVIVLCVLFWGASAIPIPDARFAPVRWVLYALLFVIALVCLLPFLGIHLGAV